MPMSTHIPKLFNGKDVKMKHALLWAGFLGSVPVGVNVNDALLSRVVLDMDKTSGKGGSSMKPA